MERMSSGWKKSAPSSTKNDRKHLDAAAGLRVHGRVDDPRTEQHQPAEGALPERALAAILRSTGLSGQGPNTVSFTGGAGPLLPTSFRIAAAGAAALAAA